jgi:large subunit ribosomal protein L29
MKFPEIKDLTEAELTAKGRELRMELFNMRLQKTTGQLEKTSKLKQVRRDIARIETRISQIRIQAAAK